MSENQGHAPLPEEKYVRMCHMLIFVLVLLVLFAAALNFKSELHQKELTQIIAASQAQWNTPDFTDQEPQSKIDWSYVAMGLYLLMLGVLAFLHLGIFRPALASLVEQRRQLNRYAALDTLTGVYNRAMLFKVARQLIGTYQRQEQPMTVMAVDIDKLRKTNETHGRAAGDAVIKKVAATISATLRRGDLIGRLGGDEFGIFLPSVDKSRASAVAEKIRAAVEAMKVNLKEKEILATISIGVVEMNKHHNTPDALLLSAETALRRAKEEGGNRTALFTFVETGK